MLSGALDLSPQQRTLAIAGSVGLHLLLLWFLSRIPLDHYAVPIVAQKNPEPFKVRRIEMPTGSLRTEGVPGPRFAANPSSDPNPSPQFSSDGRLVEQVLQSQEPRLNLPTPPEAATATSPNLAPTAAGQSTPYTFSDQAKFEKEIAQFPMGASSQGAPASGENAGTEAGGSGTSPGLGGAAGNAGPLQSGSAGVPGFQDIQADLRPLEPGLRAPEFEPVLLRLPSDIVFDFDSAKLSPQAPPLLQQACDVILKTPRAEILIEGHTDTIGTAEYNLKLSQARAETVAAWFRTKLTDSRYKVVAKGYGESRPLLNPQGSIEEQKANRRVEITIQSLPQ
jgi:outer membrane protein OmpA-like peptidoglycan-associated protein